MSAFMEESGVEKRNGQPHRGRIFQSNFKIFASYQGPSAPLQFLEYQIRNCLFKPHRLVGDAPFRVAGIATDDVVLKGGDGSMH